MSDELEDSDRSRIRQLIQDTVQQPMLGEVTQVFPRDEETAIVNTEGIQLFPDDEDPNIRPSNHEVTVAAPPGVRDQTFERRPVMTTTSGVVASPQPGDLVLVVFPARSELPFVLGNLYGDSDQTRAPLGDPGVIRFKRGSLYVELAADGTSARLAKKTNETPIPADTAEPDSEVSLSETGDITISDDGGSGNSVTIDSGGSVNIDVGGAGSVNIDVGDAGSVNIGGGDISVQGDQITVQGDQITVQGTDVEINEGGAPQKVLTENAVFEYEQRVDTGTGGGGTNTKQTTPVSNGAVTETDIE
jgi:hypothetical protein